ncbi:hypothetical protein ANTQUA_LOCUS4888 [Anthophora quadrimaculata]
MYSLVRSRIGRSCFGFVDKLTKQPIQNYRRFERNKLYLEFYFLGRFLFLFIYTYSLQEVSDHYLLF